MSHSPWKKSSYQETQRAITTSLSPFHSSHIMTPLWRGNKVDIAEGDCAPPIPTATKEKKKRNTAANTMPLCLKQAAKRCKYGSKDTLQQFNLFFRRLKRRLCSKECCTHPPTENQLHPTMLTHHSGQAHIDKFFFLNSQRWNPTKECVVASSIGEHSQYSLNTTKTTGEKAVISGYTQIQSTQLTH